MQTKQIPLTLIGIDAFQYQVNENLNLNYDFKTQMSDTLLASMGNRATVSACATYSGLTKLKTDDEERDSDD